MAAASTSNSQHSQQAYSSQLIPQDPTPHNQTSQNSCQYSCTSSHEVHQKRLASDFFNQGGTVESDRAVSGAAYTAKLKATIPTEAARLLGAKYEASLHLLISGFTRRHMNKLLLQMDNKFLRPTQETIQNSKSPNASLLHYWMAEHSDNAEQVFEKLISEIKEVSPSTGGKLADLNDKTRAFLLPKESISQMTKVENDERCSYLVNESQVILNDHLTASDLADLLYIAEARQLISAEDYKKFQAEAFDEQTDSVVEKWFSKYQILKVNPNEALRELAEVIKAIGKVIAGDTLLNLLVSY